MINHLYGYGITASYDEIRRFKISAASSSGKEITQFNCENGLIQGVSDNFDATLSTQNGLKQTHSLASIVIQHNRKPAQRTRKPIPRLKKNQLSTTKLNSIELRIFSGPSKPRILDQLSCERPLSQQLQNQQKKSLEKERAADFQFMKDILEKPAIPDHEGYNAKLAREHEVMNEKSSILFTPLINKKTI